MHPVLVDGLAAQHLGRVAQSGVADAVAGAVAFQRVPYAVAGHDQPAGGLGQVHLRGRGGNKGGGLVGGALLWGGGVLVGWWVLHLNFIIFHFMVRVAVPLAQVNVERRGILDKLPHACRNYTLIEGVARSDCLKQHPPTSKLDFFSLIHYVGFATCGSAPAERRGTLDKLPHACRNYTLMAGDTRLSNLRQRTCLTAGYARMKSPESTSPRARDMSRPPGQERSGPRPDSALLVQGPLRSNLRRAISEPAAGKRKQAALGLCLWHCARDVR